GSCQQAIGPWCGGLWGNPATRPPKSNTQQTQGCLLSRNKKSNTSKYYLHTSNPWLTKSLPKETRFLPPSPSSRPPAGPSRAGRRGRRKQHVF
ncbi:unnamed protein product, partial [Laminaria digitata]